jgi:type VI secretion system secreted protein VgrG
MMTSIRSQSLGGSGGSNEITMNDSGGAEGLFIKAQKDEIHVVGNDRSDTVGHDETREVGNDRTRKVGNNETVTIGVNQSTTVGQNIVIDAGTSITLKCGASSIHMNQAGFITISGSVISIAGSASCNMAAPLTNVVGGVMVTTTGAINLSSGMIHKITAGRLATMSAPQTEIEGSTTAMINGGEVLINC